MSAACAYGFNKTAVNNFFNNLEAVLTTYTFTCNRNYISDESGIPTLMSTSKILAKQCRIVQGLEAVGSKATGFKFLYPRP